jgi:hypothetical protein
MRPKNRSCETSTAFLCAEIKIKNELSSTLRILSGEAEGFGESIPKFDGNFHAVWALPGH